MNTTRGNYWLAKSAEEKQLQEIILATLRERNLYGWSVIFSRESNRLGYCNWTTKEIAISRKVILTSWTEAMDTAMHEVAHAIAGHTAKHGPEWKRIAAELGAQPRAKAEYVNLHQAGEKKTVKTSYGPVEVLVGSTVTVQGSVGELKVLEIQRKYFIGESKLGSYHRMPIELLHPNYGDSSKVPQRKVTLKDHLGRRVEVTLGKSSYIHKGETFVAVEAKTTKVLTMNSRGARLMVPAVYFREQG